MDSGSGRERKNELISHSLANSCGRRYLGWVRVCITTNGSQVELLNWLSLGLWISSGALHGLTDETGDSIGSVSLVNIFYGRASSAIFSGGRTKRSR